MADPDQETSAPKLLDLSFQRLLSGDLDEAEALAQRALTLARGRGGASPEAVQAFYVLSEIAERRGNASRGQELVGAAYGSVATRWKIN